jgi:hypothetical protein
MIGFAAERGHNRTVKNEENRHRGDCQFDLWPAKEG